MDTTYSCRAPHSGTAVYIDRVTDALARLEGIEVETIANARRRLPAGGGLGSLRNLLIDRWWTAVELPRLARRLSADVIHHPLPALMRSSSLPQVITVHDLAFERLPQQFARAFRLYAHRAHRAAALAASAVICVSDTTAREVQALWGVATDRIVVAPHGPGQDLPRPRTHGSESAPRHFLYVGDDEPRKNLRVLLAAYAAYRGRAERPLDLLLAGSADANGPGVRVERWPSRERLSELYATAVALIQPSLYEGFGLTALEAMTCGTPVLASDIPGLREVCGDAALYSDPHDPQIFATAIAEIARQPKLREQLAERGRRRAALFSWATCARAHLTAYSLACGSRLGPLPFEPRKRA
jgi:glycosyltransferase involved in cell wall biosynthesis